MPRNRLCQIAAAAAIVFVMTGAVPDARAATADAADAASAPAEASAPLVAGSQYTIHPGQSLNDVAIAATQSHDPATLVRASRALFDANPNAFMAHDPSRLRLGAVLTIPALDATGAAVEASGASAATATAASGSAQVAMATAASGAAQAQPQPQPAVIAQANPASAAQQGTPGTANAASESLQANPVAAGVASAPSAASASATASVAASAAVGVSSASSAAAPASASQASGAHVWTGSIQPSVSAEASASGPAAAGQATTQVSSLQQLLALKSRVLMELQKHGIGGGTAAQPSGGAVTAAGEQAGATHGAASGSAAANIGMANGHPATDAGPDSSSTNLGIAAAIGAALVALLAGLGLRRRKRAAGAAEAADAAVTAREAALVTLPVPSEDGEEGGEAAAGERAVVDEAVEHQVAGAEATEADEVAHEANSQATTAQEAAAQEEAAPQETSADDAASPSASASQSPAAASQEPAAYDPAAFPANRPLQQSADESAPVASEPVTFEHPSAEEAPEQASQELTRGPEHQGFEPPPASSLDLGTASAESTVPQEPSTSAVEPSDRGTLAELPTGEQTAHTPSEEAAPTEPPAGYNPLQPQSHSGAPEADQHIEPNHGHMPTEPAAASAESSALSDENAFAAESHTNEDEGQWGTPEAFPLPEPLDPFPAELAAPKGFPREAVDAFGSLDLGLPPRTDSDAVESPPVSLDTHPVVEPETSAQHAIAPPPAAPLHVADEIAAGTAGAAAVAGLGAARFGALNLDFDLELPPSPAQPLPLFTAEDLGRIARNKLDLASEYIELGDLAGARALIHEVIEANDATTRSEARALLSTLAPLS